MGSKRDRGGRAAAFDRKTNEEGVNHERPETSFVLRKPFAGSAQRPDRTGAERGENLRRLCLRKHARAAAEPARSVLNAPARAAHRLHGNGHVLYDQLPVRIQPRAARACHRGRLQFCRLHDHAGRLHDDEPRRREHGAAQDHGQEQAEVLLRVHGDPDEGG